MVAEIIDGGGGGGGGGPPLLANAKWIMHIHNPYGGMSRRCIVVNHQLRSPGLHPVLPG